MEIKFDPKKSYKNEQERGLPFDYVAEFDWETAFYTEDTRYSYSERRFIAVGYLKERLYVLCFTPIPKGVRVISFRKANSREIRHYENKTINK